MTDIEKSQEVDARKDIKEVTKGLCGAFKVFSLGANGTAYVGCGLYDSHKEGKHPSNHRSVQENEDGSKVTFTWPL